MAAKNNSFFEGPHDQSISSDATRLYFATFLVFTICGSINTACFFFLFIFVSCMLYTQVNIQGRSQSIIISYIFLTSATCFQLHRQLLQEQ